MMQSLLVVVDCNNNWVVSHGNGPLHPFPTNQSQANILCIFKNLVAAQLFCVQYKYIQSHGNNTKRWQECLLKEQINIKVDSLAKKALKAAHSTGECIESAFPNEQIWISMGGKKVKGFLWSKLEEFWGRSTAKKVFHKKGIVSSAHFDSVWWLWYKRAISNYPKTFCTFITKQVSGWYGCNSKLLLWEENIINKCPQCGCNHETSKHLTRCTDPSCVLQLRHSIKTIMDVLNNANVTSKLADIIETYLLNQGHQTMEDCIKPNSKYLHLFVNIDSLGWDCFVEG